MKLVFMRRSDQEVPPANRTIKGRGCDAPPKLGNGTSCCMERGIQSAYHVYNAGEVVERRSQTVVRREGEMISSCCEVV